MKVFYHQDADGRCAASIMFNHAFTSKNPKDYIEINYGNPFPFDIIEDREEVYILDWSLNQEENGWEKLMSITTNIIWIDHHATAIKGCPYKFKGILNTEQSGCELTYNYLYPESDIPLYIKLIGDYDTWKFKYGESSVQMHNAIMLYDYSPWSDFWRNISNPGILDTVLGNGTIIGLYKKQEHKEILNSFGYIAKFNEYEVPAINANSGSKVFDSLKTYNSYPFCIVYRHGGDFFVVSLYSSNKDIDCGEIAKQYGGGGHKGAAGFKCKELPFIKVKKLID